MSTQLTQLTQPQEEGNTKPPPNTRSRKWCFTLNNYTDENLTQILKYIEASTDTQYIIGKEVGEEKTPHLQGFISFKFQKSFQNVKKGLGNKAHIEKARGSLKQNYDYCAKDGDFVSNMDLRSPADKLREMCMLEYKNVLWHPFQKKIVALVDDKIIDPRAIFWFYEENGNVGKSYLAKYLALTRDVIICDGKKADIFNQVKMCIDAGKIPRVILLDVPRSCIGYINYGVIESLKNGLLYSGKYEGGQCIYPIPHVIVLANKEPDYLEMSQDRWIVEKIES